MKHEDSSPCSQGHTTIPILKYSNFELDARC
jgi:hypothetical protein